MMPPLLACGAGIYLGLYFNIRAVLPFTVLGAGAFIFSSWQTGHSLLDNVGVLLFPIILVQAGYMLGLTAREPYARLLARLHIGQSERV